MPYGFVRIFLFFILFFRRQGFRMIIFDRQAGPLQNFNRSHVMVIGRSVSCSDPRDPRVGAWGTPNTPKSPPPPPEKKCVHVHVGLLNKLSLSEPQEHFRKKYLVGKINLEICRLPPPPQTNFCLFVLFAF